MAYPHVIFTIDFVKIFLQYLQNDTKGEIYEVQFWTARSKTWSSEQQKNSLIFLNIGTTSFHVFLVHLFKGKRIFLITNFD